MADQSGYHFNGVTPMNSVTAEITIVSIVNETVTNASSTLSLEDKQTIQYLQDVRKSILDWYMWVIFAFGFPGNLMGLVIILRLRCFGSPAVYVGTLAVVDNLAIILKVTLVILAEQKQSMTGSTSSPSQYPHPSHSRAGVQSQVTVLLVVTSAVLVLTTTPVCVYMLVQTSWKPPEGTLEHYRKSLISTAVRVVCDANHSVNFYLYFISARKFRNHFYNVMCWLCTSSDEGNSRPRHPLQNSATSRSTIRVKDRSSGYLLLFKRKRSAYERCANNQIVMKDMPNNVDKGNGHETVRKVCSGENTV
ncbi:hypothetical protein BaRGS_00039082 [Batillaria attramentaria]|uniref:G-protein coupled receptors family 1 profile domain-containing protein n=1 Tax=Batillaria attramentaria TaxID=370345 RepID=A0ABD0J4S3_9CAEN